MKTHSKFHPLFVGYHPKYTEQSLTFLLIMTIVGGYMNGYSYVTRGGSLVSMQSGNMARIGIAAYTQDLNLFIISVIPVVGCLIGCTLAYIGRDGKKESTPIYWQRLALIAEIILFIVVGFIPTGFHNHWVNLTIAVVAGFQLCSLKSYRGYAHTTTLASGNVRNLGHILADLILKRDLETLQLFIEYTILFVSFTGGAFLGVVVSVSIGAQAIWVCCFLLFVLLLQMYSPRAYEEERRYRETHYHLEET
ncbi:MAG: YoaK family protein [Eubacteriales bacterium]